MFTVERQVAWSWPPNPAAIAALMDLGLSPAMIAKYFAVPESRVVPLLDEYGLTELAACER